MGNQATAFPVGVSGMSYALIDDDALQLCCAIRTRDIAEIRFLLNTISDINFQDENGETALHTAVWNDCPDAVQELIDSGANVNIRNKNSQTPLHIAASRGHSDITQILLEASADTDVQTKFAQMTALHLASQNGHTDIVQMLVDHGTQTEVKDAINKTPVFYAANREIREILEKANILQSKVSKYLENPKAHRSQEITIKESEDFQDIHQNQNKSLTEVDQAGKPDRRETVSPSLKIGSRPQVRDDNDGTSTRQNQTQWYKPKQKRKPIQHKLKFSNEHEKIMQMNVFDRLTRKK